MNQHLRPVDRPIAFPQPDAPHIPQAAFEAFLRQYMPAPTSSIQPQIAVQSNIEQASELQALKDAQKKQEALSAELVKTIARLNKKVGRTAGSGSGEDSFAMGDDVNGSEGGRVSREPPKKRRKVKKKSKFVLNVKLDNLDEEQADTHAELMVDSVFSFYLP
jgi:hypothetical protein